MILWWSWSLKYLTTSICTLKIGRYFYHDIFVLILHKYRKITSIASQIYGDLLVRTWLDCERMLYTILLDSEAEIKWPLFFLDIEIHFLEWKCMNLYYDFTKFCSKGPTNNIPALVQKMALRQTGDTPMSDPIIVGLLRHINVCVIRPQRVNESLDLVLKLKSWHICPREHRKTQ